ncbi:MAG: glycosyltransferase family 39 protein [Candidatus Methanoperedens sp.]|nr:glycosyltransferase family 39 protein [Candidatus Methanoperedens sp.]
MEKIHNIIIFVKSHRTGPIAIAVYFALIKLLIHLFTNGQYGYFRDELYFLESSEHLNWGYVDFPPLVALITKFTTTLLGTSLPAIRFLPAVAGALKVLSTGLIVKEFGGGRFAVALACLSVLIAPIYLGMDTVLTTNAFEPVFWIGTVYFIILAVNHSEPRFWLGAGVLAGLGIINKYLTLLFILGIFIGFLLTKERRFLSDRRFMAAGLIAFLIALPNIIWQYQHNWPMIEVMQNVAATGKNVMLSPLDFVISQIMILHPFTAPVWVAGLWFFFFHEQGKRYRMFGIAYMVILGVMLVTNSKVYYIQAYYPMLFAGGAVFWDKLWQGKHYTKWLKSTYLAILVIGGAALAPMMLPVLSVDDFLSYQHALGIETPKTEVGHVGPLPQWYGDMFGWSEMVETVAKVYNNLPPQERAKAAIAAVNYGEAGAIDFFGPGYGIPKAISGHQNYYLWGPRNYTGDVIILLGFPFELANQKCGGVEEAGKVGHPYAMAEEHYTIFICRDYALQENWPEWKHWN